MPIVELIQRYQRFNPGERVEIAENVAEQWCGEINPRFRVAVRVPYENLTDPQKALYAPPENKMVGISDETKGQDTPRRPPGRPRRDE